MMSAGYLEQANTQLKWTNFEVDVDVDVDVFSASYGLNLILGLCIPFLGLVLMTELSGDEIAV